MRSKVRTVQVVPSIAEEASGPTYSVMRQCEVLIDVGEDVQLATLRSGLCSSDRLFVREFPRGVGPRRLGRSPEMLSWLRDVVLSKHVNIIHSHGLWMMPNVYAGWVTRRHKCHLIISPCGTLSEGALSHSAYVKRLFWWLLQDSACRHASCFHATAESELEDIRRAGFVQPVCIIPIGIDVPPLRREVTGSRRELLFLGRIHPIKGVDILLRAWRMLADRFPDWDLHIVGPDNDGYLPKMRKLAIELGLQRLKFSGPLYGEEKWRAFDQADLFVLPTHSENFGVTIAEALAAGTPAVVTRGAPWSELKLRGAGWWIDIGVDPLVACLTEAMSEDPKSLMARGARGREWMMEEYSWARVGNMMDQTYKWLLSGSEMPNWVHLD